MSVLLQNEKRQQSDDLFSNSDHAMWEKLYAKQSVQLYSYATEEFQSNLKRFDLSRNRIPTIQEISEKLYSSTGWGISPVDGLIGYNNYFSLLKQKLFPTAMFMRKEREEDLCKDPDFFHEVFGHCTMLLSKDYAQFMENFAEFALTVEAHDRALFSRIMWFGTETALINTAGELKIFGSSILSSHKESKYAISNKSVIRKPFDPISIFREPYRADILQRVYYILEKKSDLYRLLDNIPKLYRQLNQARELGEFAPIFEVSNDKYSNIGHCKQLQAEPA